MTSVRMSLFLGCAMAVVSPSLGAQESAASYPSRPVRVVNASAPGGGLDVFVRQLTVRLTNNLKQTFVVDNRPGAGSAIAYREVVKAVPDAYTVVAATPAFMWAKQLQPELDFDPAKGLTPISLVAVNPLFLTVRPGLPVKSLKDLIAYAKARPGEVKAGTTNGTMLHLAMVMLSAASGAQFTMVPYKGSAPLMLDLDAGRLDIQFGGSTSSISRIKAGKAIPLAVSIGHRAPAMPDVPTVAELGFPGFDVSSWHAWLTTTGSPAASINKLSKALSDVVKAPDFAKTLAVEGGIAVGNTPEQFREMIARSSEAYLKVIKEHGFALD